MPDDWLHGGSVPTFERERKFSRPLKEQLDGVSVRSPYVVGETFTLDAEHEPRRDDGCLPDITVHHDIDFDDASDADDLRTRQIPSNPFYIECKLGDAFRGAGDTIESYTDTGIQQFHAHSEQLRRYKHGDTPVEHVKATDHGQTTYRELAPDGEADVVLACPYFLCANFPHPPQVDGVCGDQFTYGQFNDGFGMLYRYRPGAVRLSLSSNDHFYFGEPSRNSS